MNKSVIKVLTGAYLLLVVWWLYIWQGGLVDTDINFFYGLCYAIIPFFGGYLGIKNAKRWGLTNSFVGRALLFFSLGLITWAVGNFIFAYYNLLLKVAIPYPSLADVAYVISWPLWAVGIINLGKAIGTRFDLKKIRGKFVLAISTLIAIFFSYYFLVVIAKQGGELSGSIIKMFFDVAYSIGDILILTLVVVTYNLSRSYLGGYFKAPVIIILLGFALNYLGDFSFSYTVSRETFFVANWVDLIYTSAMFFLTLGISSFNPESLTEAKR